MNDFVMDKLHSEKLTNLPSVNSLLKISLGLILFTIISTVFVYAETIPVDVEGNSFDVEYTADQLIVKSITTEYEPANDYAGLLIEVEVTGDLGTLDFVFDRTFFDSTFEGAEDEFFVIVDGDFAIFSETENTSQSRSISIEVPAGSLDVEVIGSVFGQPVEETPVEEPVEETPVEDKTVSTQCGPGTILKDGACVLDSTFTQSGSSVQGMGKEMVMGVIIAFVAAGTVAVVFGMISKASKSSS